MGRILLWNAVATRRRSASDTFFDNGLGVIKAHLEQEGHEVLLEDWATDDMYSSLSSRAVARRVRAAYKRLLAVEPGEPSPPWVQSLEDTVARLQEKQSSIQHQRMEARLRKLVRRVAKERIPVVGMKLWYGEAFTWAKRLAEMLRETTPEALIVAGGYHATLYEEDVLRMGAFDIGVCGEGEYALSEILSITDKLLGGSKSEILNEIVSQGVKNVMWREGDLVVVGPKREVGLGKKAFPVYGAAPGKVRIHVMLESLGCPWGKCNFCVHPHFYGTYEPRAVPDVVDEMRALVTQGVGIFRFAGSDTPPPFGAKIAQGVLDAGLTVVFGMGSRAVRGCANPEVYRRTVRQYEIMLRGGLRSVFIGGKTGHDRINAEIMNKGIQRDDVVATSSAIREAQERSGIRLDLVLALIYPPPLVEGVTQEEVFQANIELLRDVEPDSVMVTPPGPFKHSKWYTENQRFGFEFDDGFLRSLMEYEYVLYKPPTLWPKLALKVQGKPYEEVLFECSRFRKSVERLGIPTDLSDEHFLMLRAAGYMGKAGAEEFKRETLLDIVSCDYRQLSEISSKINLESERLAVLSKQRLSINAVSA